MLHPPLFAPIRKASAEKVLSPLSAQCRAGTETRHFNSRTLQNFSTQHHYELRSGVRVLLADDHAMVSAKTKPFWKSIAM